MKLNIIKKKYGRRFVGKGVLAKTFNFLMTGRRNAPLSRFNFWAASSRLLTYLMRKRDIATLNELIDAAIALNVNLYVCEMSMNILEIKKSDYISEAKEVLGGAKF